MEGIVVKSTGSSYTVRDSFGELHSCRVRGNFRLKGIKSTNPVAVGDHVEFDEQEGGWINSISNRRNYIIRKSTNLSRQTHILAANIDQAFLVVTIASPRTSSGFIDRFLVAAEAFHIPVSILFNKDDLLNEKSDSKREMLMGIYESIGYKCIRTSAYNGEGIEKLRILLNDKTNFFCGHSGAGKSSLINTIDPALTLRTGEISSTHQKGKHTTTFAEMFEITSGGRIIDTPGIKEFGLVDMEKWEISHRFPEMRLVLGQCKFNNCLHLEEPGCAVKKAVTEGRISEERYINYYNILNSNEE